MSLINFNATEVTPDSSFEPIPAGWYNAQIIESEIKATSSGTGTYLQIQLELIGGEFNNRKVFDRITLTNQNPVAVDIGKRRLSSLCHGVKVLHLTDTNQLHGKPIQIKVSIRQAQIGSDGKQYDASNEIKAYKEADLNIAPTIVNPSAPVVNPSAPVTNPNTPAVTGGSDLPPWMN